jgi:hypothetical protein
VCQDRRTATLGCPREPCWRGAGQPRVAVLLNSGRLSARVGTSYASRVSVNKGLPNLRQALRKFAAIAALLALLLPGVSTLAGALSAAELPACCNTTYCPLHHRQMSDLQRDKSNCDAAGMPGLNDCSMRACDAAMAPVVSAAAFILVTPVALRGPAAAEAASFLTSRFFAHVALIPLTPPPRIFPS